VRITADTNILLRALLEDEPEQSPRAQALLRQADTIAIPVPVFCEFVWTLRRLYRRQPAEIGEAVEAILDVATVVTDRAAVEAGLRQLRAGGDFADGAIACQGAALGGDVLATFDREAVGLLLEAGFAAAEPSTISPEGSVSGL
jgi:predicted nucleic-acid-binding protein